MNRRVVNLLLAFICCLRVDAAAAQQAVGKVMDPVVCKSDATQSYALYIPAKGNTAVLPVIYFFDPHGAGALPLNKYKALADRYGFILVGSNNSKNGNDWSTTEGMWRHLIGDTKERLKINDSRIYTCGFSGGAKAASYLALQHTEIKGVIAGGAGLPDGIEAGDLGFCFTAIAGEGDMNMTDLVTISGGLDKTPTRHHLIFFDGKHEWAPESTMDIAFAGLELDAMQKGLIPKDEGFINRFAIKSKGRLYEYNKSGRLIKARQECQLSVSFLDGVANSAAWFRQKSASIAADPMYQKQQEWQNKLLVREQNTKSEYMQHFQQGDMTYWTPVIDDLQVKARTKNPESGMHQRLLAYLSLAFYSISNQLINNNRNIQARQFVDLYKKADPSNSEAWYFSAVLYARERKTPAAESDLFTAVGYGFRDSGRLEHQPEFLDLRINFSAVESKMRGK